MSKADERRIEWVVIWRGDEYCQWWYIECLRKRKVRRAARRGVAAA